MRRAEPGEYEAETELYEWYSLKQRTLIEWGTGIDLYFISLRFFACLMLICGLVNLPGIMYYAQSGYNGDTQQTFNIILQGSAVCNNTKWVVCTDCQLSDWEGDATRIATGISPWGEETILTTRNLCSGATRENGFTNFATSIFVLLAIGIFSYYLRAREIRFDEDKVTTTDYSVVVENPPPEAINPDEWQDFFSQFATDGDQVTVVTVALNNDVMVRKLVTRRIFRDQLRVKLPMGLNLDDESAVALAVDKWYQEKEAQEVGCIGMVLEKIVIPILNIFNMLLPPADLVRKIDKLTEEIKELQKKDYVATRVFVTFETEDGQRTALDAMKVGMIDMLMNRTSAVAPECVFQGRVLRVTEPTEPNAVRWLDLSYSMVSKIVRRSIALGLTIAMIVIAGMAVSSARSNVGVLFSGLLTTSFNSTIPQIIKILMIIEPHATEGAFQASLYLKITLFRWTLSAILAQVSVVALVL